MPLLGLLVPWLRGPTLILALTMIPVVPLTVASSIYDFTLPSIDGKATPLSDCKGKVVLLVNVASRCGYTPQYSALESLYEKYKDQGFVISGFLPTISALRNPAATRKSRLFARANTA